MVNGYILYAVQTDVIKTPFDHCPMQNLCLVSFILSLVLLPVINAMIQYQRTTFFHYLSVQKVMRLCNWLTLAGQVGTAILAVSVKILSVRKPLLVAENATSACALNATLHITRNMEFFIINLCYYVLRKILLWFSDKNCAQLQVNHVIWFFLHLFQWLCSVFTFILKNVLIDFTPFCNTGLSH